MMNPKSPLEQKSILVVDDEPDVLDTIGEILDMCQLQKADDFNTALGFILNNTYDFVILDIQGVNGFDLLEKSALRGFPTIMLTAHAATPEALKKSIKLGATCFLPKEYMADLPEILEDIILGRGERFWWLKSLERTSSYFDKRFGQDWKKTDAIFKEFEDSLKKKG